MSGFSMLPFGAQLQRIAAVAREGDPRALLEEAASLPDPEPLAHLLEALARHGRLDAATRAVLPGIVARLSDPALAHVLDRREGPPELAALTAELAEHAAREWPLERASGLALLSRWLRQRAPERRLALTDDAARHTEGEPRPGAARWLFFVAGARLAELALDPRWQPAVHEALEAVIGALARAPKSISQANAEQLLARAVYASPGHFLFELLQNADDAGARRWSVEVDEAFLTVDNDGAPLSFLDLVGLLSVGQTTKGAAQIGFFGVGFKSVYEVCDRPRIYSGPFAVEIAHVSIPRRLAAPDAPIVETRLVLPLRAGVDAAALAEAAAAVPAETLLTLEHVRVMHVRAPDGRRSEWRREGGGAVVELAAAGGERRRYRRAERRLVFAGAREEGRASESRVLVMVALDERLAPVPARGPTLFAFLPTGEETGLRVKVHARFDVALDRERLEDASEWNDALLAEAGRALADAALALVAEGHSPLPVLAAPAERAARVAPLAAALTEALAGSRCVPGPDGEWIAPRDARLTSAALAGALAGIDLGGGQRAVHLEPRERAVALELGAADLDPGALVQLCAERLRDDRPPPPWLTRAALEALAEAPVEDAALRALPLLPHGAGSLAARDARLSSPPLAQLYAGLRPLLAAGALEALPPRLRERLAVQAFDPRELARDLRDDADEARRGALLEREEALLTALGEAGPALREALRAARLWRDETGRRRSIAEGLTRLAPALAELRAWLGAHRPVLDETLEAAHGALVASWLPVFGFDALADALEEGLADALDEPARAALLRALDRHAASLPRALLRRFAAHRLALDRHGVPRALVGPERALRCGEAALRQGLPRWPWLAAEGAFVEGIDAPRYDASSLAAELVEGARSLAPEDRAWALSHLAEQASTLTAAQVSRLLDAAVWPDSEGRPRLLSALRRGGSGAPAVDRLYAASGARAVAHPVVPQLLRALARDERLPASDHAALALDLCACRIDAGDLEGGADAGEPGLLVEALGELVAALPVETLRPLRDAPIFEDERGARRPLAPWDAPDERACHRPGPFRELLRGAGLPLIDAGMEAPLAPLLDLIGPPTATAADVVARAARGLEAGAPEALLRTLAENAAALDEPARSALASLPLFEARDGSRHPLLALADPELALAHLGPARLVALAPDSAWLSDDTRALILRLELSPRPLAPLLEARARPALQLGAPLAEQPAFAQDVGGLHALATLFSRAGLELLGAPLALDAQGALRQAPLFAASAAALTLLEHTPLAARVAHPAWLAGLPPGSPLVTPLPARLVAEALRAAAPEERDRPGPDPRSAALYRWLGEASQALSDDAAALAALGEAAVLPSARGTLTKARLLVLDPSVPDLGLGWGLASDVPPDVGAWLAARFELDRRGRRALVGHVLDGLDEAAERDDRGRAGQLLAYLAHVLGAARLDADALEARVRRSGVRKRLRVPLRGGGWDKPRFAWSPADEVAEAAPRFALELPPRLDLRGLDAPARRVLEACGAQSDLDDSAIDALLEGEGRLVGASADRAFARYVAARAFAEPRRIADWGLADRAWVPDRGGALRAPRELLGPSALARALFGDDHPAFPDPEALRGLPSEAATQLGFAAAEALDLDAVAQAVRDRVARPALLAWLEDGLRERRLDAGALGRALRDRLLLEDDEGVARRPYELAEAGARALFGARRGDCAQARDHRRLARALGVPRAPDAAMIVALLAEVGDELRAATSRGALPDEGELLRRLPACLERLGELAEADPALRLPDGAAVSALAGRGAVLTCVGAASLRMHAPAGLAEALHERLEAVADPMPTSRARSLERLLLASGVPDLWALFETSVVIPGPALEHRQADAEALHASLAPLVRGSLGRAARAVEGLVLEGAVTLGGERTTLSCEADAALHDGVLWLTPEALAEPARLADVIAPRDPKRRAGLAHWLEAQPLEGGAKLPRRLREGGTGASASEVERGWFARLRRLFVDDEAEENAAPPRAKPSGRRSRPAPQSASDARFFRPQQELRAQLEGGDGWVESRRERPEIGFAFAPPTLEPPWVYAPKVVATDFDRGAQTWRPAPLARPRARRELGVLSMRGRLPAGESVFPVPHYGRLEELRVADGDATSFEDESGATVVRLERASDVHARLVLGPIPNLDRARVADAPHALQSVVPDAELPEETLALVADLELDAPPIETVLAVRDFVRRRYRYDPTYLEDPAVGRWLAKITRGRINAHLAALHVGRDGKHLGAGVCYELNVLVCELLRRAGVPAAIATGWVLTGGALSEPDHLWAIALLRDAQGGPAWVPVDASSTDEGRPLRVPQRPPGRFRAPKVPKRAAPPAPKWDLGRGRGRSTSGTEKRAKPKRRRVPRAELLRVVRHLERVSGKALGEEERGALEAALEDPARARELLDRLRG